MGGAALADCSPAAADGVAAVCSGTTINQAGGAPGTSAGLIGYGTGSESPLSVDVLPGATVTGTNWGIRLDTSTVTNYGTVRGSGTAGIATSGVMTNYGTVTGFNGITGSTATVTNYGTITADNFGVSANTATVTNYGTITATSRGVTGGDMTVVNYGAITGTNLYGISGSTNVSLTNSGTISGGSVGVNANNTGTINNAGTISGFTYGVFGNTLTIVNSGTIEARNAGGAAVNVNTRVNLDNSGLLKGGIQGATIATVNNSGTIAGYNSGLNVGSAYVTNSGVITGNTFGVRANDGTINNTGTIASRTGIVAFSGLRVTNTGTIRGTGGTAIDFSAAANDTLTLLAGSRIIGAIKLGGGDNVTVNAGRDISSLTTFMPNGAYTLQVSGGAPFVVAGDRVAVVDATGIAGADRAVMDFTRAISGLLHQRGEETQSGPGAMAYAADNALATKFDDVFERFHGGAGLSAASFRNASVVTADGGGVWTKGFGGRRIQQGEGATLRSVTGFYGGAIGYDRLMRSDLRLGAFVGAGTTRQDIDANSGSTDSDIVFGGVYGRWMPGASFLDMALSAGISRNAITRNIANNLAAGGMETAKADSNGWFVSPALSYGYRIPLGAGLVLTPAGYVRYVAASFGGYAESGSASALTVGARTMQNAEERGELKLVRTTVLPGAAQLRTNAQVGVLAVQRLAGTNVSAVLLGQDLTFAAPGKPSVVGLYAGTGFDLRTSSRMSIFAAMEYSSLSDSSSVLAGQGGLRFAF